MKKHKTAKNAISLIFIFTGLFLLVCGINRQIEPNLDAVSRLKAQGMVNKIVSETVAGMFSNSENAEELFLTKSKDGAVQLVQANTALMNRKLAQLNVELQEKFDAADPETIHIPIGSVFGSVLLSQSDQGISIKVLPLSVSKCDFETEFESQGINQTKYKIFAVIESSVRVIQPFSQENFDITTKMLICEVIIVGDVPESYVVVPKEDILDVT